MPRSFEFFTDHEADVDEILGTFAEEAYWQARLEHSGVDVGTLETLLVDDSPSTGRTIEVVTLQTVLRAHLPTAVTALIGGDLRVRRAETWKPRIGDTATAAVSGAVLDSPMSLDGTATLSSLSGGAGSRLAYHLNVRVRIPLIGGKIEEGIGAFLTELAETEQRFTAEWLAGQH